MLLGGEDGPIEDIVYIDPTDVRYERKHMIISSTSNEFYSTNKTKKRNYQDFHSISWRCCDRDCPGRAISQRADIDVENDSLILITKGIMSRLTKRS